MAKKRPPVRIRFKYNVDTGEIEEFIIDDNAPTASEEYHDKIAESIASQLGHEPDIIDAGPLRLPRIEPQPVEGAKEKEEEREKLEE
jgi:hypothetical protein